MNHWFAVVLHKIKRWLLENELKMRLNTGEKSPSNAIWSD